MKRAQSPSGACSMRSRLSGALVVMTLMNVNNIDCAAAEFQHNQGISRPLMMQISIKAHVLTADELGAGTGNYVVYAEICGYAYLNSLKDSWQKLLDRAPQEDFTLKNKAILAFQKERDIRTKDLQDKNRRNIACAPTDENYRLTIFQWKEFIKNYHWPSSR
jgi:hypothetical protein